MITNKETKETLSIIAKCNSDDGNVKIEFDVISFFESELKNHEDGLKSSLIALDMCGFGGDYATDVLAEHYSDSTTEELFTYLDIVNKDKIKCGYYCEVSKDNIICWLKENKPEFIQILE
tara:strand:+ start:42 stop:401 length:360 start_codon:yes stop_codon:yes gene_type:complete